MSSIPYSGPHNVAAAQGSSLFRVVEQGNKLNVNRLKDYWSLMIEGPDCREIVAYIRPSAQQDILWDDEYFSVDHETKTVCLHVAFQQGDDGAAACSRAFWRIMEKNKNRSDEFSKWLEKPKFYPLHVAVQSLQDLAIPLPLRGLLGVVTVGVHLNVYTVRTEGLCKTIDRIWVSKRAKTSGTYPGMLDQIVAGAMETDDCFGERLAPACALKREALEEAGFAVDLRTRSVSVDEGAGGNRRIGVIETVDSPLTFYDDKDANAGKSSKGHLEPGVRFVYDLKLEDPGFTPTEQEDGVEKFEALTVEHVKQTLLEGRWKPNCGLVMLDFLVRHQLVTKHEEPRLEDIISGLHRALPFDFVREGCRHFDFWE